MPELEKMFNKVAHLPLIVWSSCLCSSSNSFFWKPRI